MIVFEFTAPKEDRLTEEERWSPKKIKKFRMATRGRKATIQFPAMMFSIMLTAIKAASTMAIHLTFMGMIKNSRTLLSGNIKAYAKNSERLRYMDVINAEVPEISIKIRAYTMLRIIPIR